MFKAKLLQPEVDYKTGHVIARAEILEGNYREFYDAMAEHKGFFRLIIEKWRNRRSADANAYFHVLVGKIADAMDMSKAEAKNRMLSLYGQIVIREDNKPEYLIVPDDKPVEQWEELHLRATSQTKELTGVTYRVYMQVRGSHTYDSKEMSALINGTIQEARDAGLSEAEIMSTKEKDMLKQYGVLI